MFGKLTTAEIDSLLHHQFIGRIGCHAEGLTYVVPVSYAYDGTYVYARTFDGMKITMMRKNPEVCFEVDNTKNLANWQSVVAWGAFEELANGPVRDAAIKILEQRALPFMSSETMHISPQWPFPSEEGDSVDGIIFRIELKEKTGRFEKNADEAFYGF